MIHDLFEKKEKKVEYLELIYDLIFVYIIGRNNGLLHHSGNVFENPGLFLPYILCTLAVIQIWNYTTYYVNIYGKNGVREHVFMFVNMFLLFFVAQGTRVQWQDQHTVYHVAWALILCNIAFQYLMELRSAVMPIQRQHIYRQCAMLFGQAAVVLLAIGEFALFGTSVLSAVAVVGGIVMSFAVGWGKGEDVIDFPHLSERAMLYVVFTFGEMIIALSSYFEDDLSLNTLYFAGMAFLIVVGLFLSYGVIYDHLIDREQKTNGLGYMLIHLFLIFALNNITNALAFMRDEEVSVLPKVVFMAVSLLLLYTMLFALGKYAKVVCRPKPWFFPALIGGGILFGVLMVVFHENMYVNIALTVVFVFTVFAVIYRFAQKSEQI